jgi:myo-inositol-1(or 4)-monophosphatase
MSSTKYLDFTKSLAKDAGHLTLRYFRKPLRSEQKAGFKGIVTEADLETEKFIISKIKAQFPEHLILAEESAPEIKKIEGDKFVWMIDPIDGTTNFAQGNVYYNVSIALYKISGQKSEGIVGCVYQPFTDELYYAEKGKGAFLNGTPIHVSNRSEPSKGSFATGFSYNSEENFQKVLKAILAIRNQDPNATIRVNGAAALDMCRTAQGIVDGFWEFNLAPWDMAAGNIIVQEAGGVVSNFTGNGFDPLHDPNVICGSKETHRLLAEIVRPIFS